MFCRIKIMLIETNETNIQINPFSRVSVDNKYRSLKKASLVRWCSVQRIPTSWLIVCTLLLKVATLMIFPRAVYK